MLKKKYGELMKEFCELVKKVYFPKIFSGHEWVIREIRENFSL